MATINELIDNFTLKIYKKLSTENKNLFASPYNVSAAIMLTMLGAQGDSLKQITQALDIAGIPDPHQAFKNIQTKVTEKNLAKVSTANKIYARDDLEINEKYKTDAAKYYESGIELVDFKGNPNESRIKINKWIEEKTNNKIKDLIPADAVDASTSVILTSAIHFKGNWIYPFPESKTKKLPFIISPTETCDVEMMHIYDEKLAIGVCPSMDCKILELAYEGKELSMIIILPDKNDGLSEFESKFSIDTYKELMKTIKFQYTDIYIPKFKMESSLKMNSVLGEMGIKDIFTEKANFSAMINSTKKVQINCVVHNAVISVDEKGTEAAAATGIIGRFASGGANKDPITFKADHPFIFMIKDDNTQNILFIGRYSNPKEL